MNILITGGCGFLGHHVVEHIIKNTDWDITIIDKLTYASTGFDRLRDIQCYNSKRIRIFTTDLCTLMRNESDLLRREIGYVDYIVHLGAETHVDDSIMNPEPFVYSNIIGTFQLLQYARTLRGLKRMIYFSTDEVFGPAPKGFAYKEWDRYNCTNPYSATKAGGEELCLAFANSYKMPITITHTMNIFGERQHPQKFIPKCIRSILKEWTIKIHADPTGTIPGSRFWIHARNVAHAIMFLLEKGEDRDKYNIVGEKEVDNLAMAKFIAEVLGKQLHYVMVDYHSSRPGHDLRYALDGTRLQQMGFKYPKTFEESLKNTIEWTLKNPQWLEI